MIARNQNERSPVRSGILTRNRLTFRCCFSHFPSMRMYLKEKIGNPQLFTGRKREIAFYLNWIERIKQESSLSSAILSRRKTGKTALLQRLYNLTFEKNMSVIPFYYEVKEVNQWALEFCKDFFLTFVYHLDEAVYGHFWPLAGPVYGEQPERHYRQTIKVMVGAAVQFTGCL